MSHKSKRYERDVSKRNIERDDTNFCWKCKNCDSTFVKLTDRCKECHSSNFVRVYIGDE